MPCCLALVLALHDLNDVARHDLTSTNVDDHDATLELCCCLPPFATAHEQNAGVHSCILYRTGLFVRGFTRTANCRPM